MLPPTPHRNRHTPYSINPIVAIYVASQFPRCHPLVQLTDKNNSSHIALIRGYRTIFQLSPFHWTTMESFTRIRERKTRFLYVQEYNHVLDGWVRVRFFNSGVCGKSELWWNNFKYGRERELGLEEVKGDTTGTSREIHMDIASLETTSGPRCGWYWSHSQLALWSLRMSEVEGSHWLCMSALMHQWRQLYLLWISSAGLLCTRNSKFVEYNIIYIYIQLL